MNESLEQVLSYIHQADDIQINEIVQAVVKRYSQVYPDWEVSFLSLPKNDLAYCQQFLRSILQSYDQS